MARFLVGAITGTLLTLALTWSPAAEATPDHQSRLELAQAQSILATARHVAAAREGEIALREQTVDELLREKAEAERRIMAPVPADLRPHVWRVSQEYGIPLALLVAVGEQESGWDVTAVGADGEIGAMQILKPTADAIKERLGQPDWTRRDPVQNLEMAAWYLRWAYDHEGSWERALAAYNGGPGAWERVPEDTRRYAAQVLSRALRLVVGEEGF